MASFCFYSWGIFKSLFPPYYVYCQTLASSWFLFIFVAAPKKETGSSGGARTIKKFIQ